LLQLAPGCPAVLRTRGGAGADPGFNQPEALPEGELLWPVSKEQQPEIVHTIEEFLDCLLFQPHLDRVVVFPNGIHLLGQQDGLPEEVRQAAAASCTVRGFLQALHPEKQEALRGRVWHYSNRGREKEVKRGDKKRALSETLRELTAQEQSGDVPMDAPLYISELRWREKVQHPVATNERVKTATVFDVYDCTPLSRRMPLWERSEGGIFVGERGAGSGMHVDQCLWSNVGRNWCGHKLFALWPFTERHAILDEAGKGAVFHLPLTQKEVGFLRRAKIVAVLRPGDVWVFSGGQPHTALCVGDGLNICAYESFVPAHPAAVGLLVRSNTKSSHWKHCWMDDDDLDELYEDVVDSLQHSLRDPGLAPQLQRRLKACEQVMREEGDSYCRELWRQEDRGERRRRREEDSEERSGHESSSESDWSSSAGSSEPLAKKARAGC